MARCRRKIVCGLNVMSADGRVWTWQVDGHEYSWCLAGQFRHKCKLHGERLLGFHKKLDSAVGWSLGWEARDKAVDVPPEEKLAGEETGPSVSSS